MSPSDETDIPRRLKARYTWMKSHSALERTSGFFLEIRAIDRRGLIADITGTLSELGCNISYIQAWTDHDGTSHGLVQVDDHSMLSAVIDAVGRIESIVEVEIRPSHRRTYGKRIIVVGGGAQVAQVAAGAIAEADRHNIRGETISVDTLPIVGERELAEAVRGVGRLHRVGIVVLAGAIMGGDITNAVMDVREIYGIPVISLKMAGSVCKVADLVVTDPTEAGVMAVMLISHVGQFHLEKIYKRTY